VRQVIEQEGLTELVLKVVSIYDHPVDADWVAELESKAGPFEVTIGNNAWPNEILAQAGYDVVNVPDLRREEYQGTVIRQRAAQGDDWQASVPDYLVEQLSSEIEAKS